MSRKFKSEFVEELRKKMSLDKGDFCKLCQIKLNDYEKLLALDYSINYIVVVKIADVVGCKIEDLFLRQ